MYDIRLQNELKEETKSYSSAKALMEAPIDGMHIYVICEYSVFKPLAGC